MITILIVNNRDEPLGILKTEYTEEYIQKVVDDCINILDWYSRYEMYCKIIAGLGSYGEFEFIHNFVDLHCSH